jgi:1-acyl-sn-glycerol-3-phosphate acyltransferase
MENLPPASDRKAGVVLLSKHQSTWETFAYPALFSHPLAYVFKRELLYVPFFGWSMARMDMIHIDRGRRTEAWNKVLTQGKRLGGQGNWVIMFPEGTRIPRGGVGNYKSGGTRLAIACGAPVVPIAVTSAKCWPRKAFVKRPGLVDVSIGKPIPSEGRQPEEMMREVESWIEAEMRKLDPEAYPETATQVPPPA